MSVRLVSHEELPAPLDGYRLIERLGRGGFGEVWKVEAPGGMLKAVKFVFGDLEAMNEDSRPAEQELKALERVKLIRHPYILTLEQFRVIDGQLIIVMELADRNLWDRYRECRGQGLQGIPREELLRYLEETAEGLDLMNNHYQIQHLDVKPQNLFLVFNHVKVADFGLAKVLEGVRATVTGGVTPVYAAPETFEGWVSRFSDQYSLAIVFQELLTGRRPFNGANTRQLLMQHINGTPELSALPLNDRALIGRALSKKPNDRWPTCSELIHALKTSGSPQASVTPQATPPTPGPRPARSTPESGAATMPNPAGHALTDSIQATRVASGSGRLGSAPAASNHEQTPPPTHLPPLVKPGQSVNGSPLPGFVPSNSGIRFVTPCTSTTQNPAQTLTRSVVLQTGRMGTLDIAPPEKSGDGSLFPALVVAIGHTGYRVAEHLKRVITERYISSERVPNVRILYIDTDPDPGAAVPAPDNPGALTAREVVPARLNRATHYMQRDTLPPVEQWMPSGLLYKLPRNPGPAAGVRAFGRLALFDHYHTIVQRVRQEIETFLTDAPLLQADKVTKRGLRTNRPRVYIVACLAGGTGSGMFLDVAYLVRHEMRQVGYVRPEVVGMFFVPPADAFAPRSNAMANTYAALAELHHFQSKKTRYATVFDKSEAPIIDGDPPFARTMISQLPKGTDAIASRPVLAAAARALFHELFTPVGRVADERRDAYRNAYPVDTPTCQTFGLFRLCWPRPEVLASATRRFAQRQLHNWSGKDAGHLREHIAGWLTEQWAERKLSFDAIVEALRDVAHAALCEDPDRVFDAFIDPLRTPSGGRMDPTSACNVLAQLIKLVGKPDTENGLLPCSFRVAMSARFEELAKETEGQVSVMAATFLEVPQYRLPGAEEAVRQISERLKGQVDALESVRVDLDKEVRSIYTRLLHAIGSLGGTGLGALAGRRANAAEVVDLLRTYAKKRLQLHMLDLALSVFHRMSGNAPEYLREINFCRSTLTDMHAELGNIGGPGDADGAPGKLILPDGCKDLDEAADQFLAALAPADLLAFDRSLQKDITRKFRGLGNVCLKPVEKGSVFREMLLNKAREFLDAKLDHSDPATVFFNSRTENGSAQPLLGEAFEEAAPQLGPSVFSPLSEMVVLGAPPGPDGDRLKELASIALPGTEFVSAHLPDDICFYREYPQLTLMDLPQLGEYARGAYQQMMASANPPHARVDVSWQPPGA